MKKYRSLLAFLIITIISTPIFASVGMDMALNYKSTVTDDSTGQEVTNPYPFSAILLPNYENGKFLMELRLPFSFGEGDSSDNGLVNFDLSVYEPLEQEDDENQAQFIAKNISHYLNLISYIQYGYDWEDFNIRFGKLSNSTIGDGALVYHYRDYSVASYDTRPGLKLKLDGKYFKLNFIGIEAITNDLANPDFAGGRIYIKPLFFMENQILKGSEIGFTELTYNASLDDDNNTTTAYVEEIYHSVALDLNIPLFKNDDYSMMLYYDMINEKNFSEDTGDDLFVAENDRSISWRTGIQGRYLSSLTYNAYLQSYIDTNADDTDNLLKSDVYQLLNKAIIPTLNGDFNVYGETGYYTTNGEGYFIIDSLLNFEDSKLDNYSVGAKLTSFKPVFMLDNIKMSIEKDYYLDTSTSTLQESFIEGLYSAKNVAFTIQTDVQYGVNVFNVGLSTTSDDEGKFNSTYEFGFRISLF